MAFTKASSLWKKKDSKQKEYLQGQLELGVLGNFNIMIYQNNTSKPGQPEFTMYVVTKDKD